MAEAAQRIDEQPTGVARDGALGCERPGRLGSRGPHDGRVQMANSLERGGELVARDGLAAVRAVQREADVRGQLVAAFLEAHRRSACLTVARPDLERMRRGGGDGASGRRRPYRR
jgi:hypothetical protein